MPFKIYESEGNFYISVKGKPTEKTTLTNYLLWCLLKNKEIKKG